MAHSPNQQDPTPPDNLGDILDKTKQVAEEIKDTADELKVVHAVLETGVQSDPGNPDVQKAVGRTQQLEEQLQESAEKLDSANDMLEKIQKSPS